MSSDKVPLLKHTRVSTQSLLKLKLSCKSKHFCFSSKAAILIILWAAVVGTAFTLFKDIVAISILGSHYAHIMDIATLDLIPYATLTVIMIFYPFSGFIADVCCGRYKIVMISLTLVLLSFLLLGIACILGFHMEESNIKFGLNYTHVPQYEETISVIILASLALVLFITALGGYQANYIQLGLDQLLEAPNEHLMNS